MIDNIKAIDSIVKARDDNTTEHNNYDQSYLSSLQLSHVEHIQANLYNFKFIAKTITPDSNRTIYINLQVLINDSSIVDNSKYYIKDELRLKLVTSYDFEKNEIAENSYRTDFSINAPNKDESDKYLKLELVNNASNTSSMIFINKEVFFKVSIFLYQLLNYNIIDGDIFLKRFSKFKVLYGKTALLGNLTADIKTFSFYWNSRYIVSFIDPTVKEQIVYSCFTKEEYEELLR